MFGVQKTNDELFELPEIAVQGRLLTGLCFAFTGKEKDSVTEKKESLPCRDSKRRGIEESPSQRPTSNRSGPNSVVCTHRFDSDNLRVPSCVVWFLSPGWDRSS